MSTDNKNNNFKKPDVDEDYLMNIISGDEPVTPPQNNQQMNQKKSRRSPKKNPEATHQKKLTTRKHF